MKELILPALSRRTRICLGSEAGCAATRPGGKSPTNYSFINESNVVKARPCRDPSTWGHTRAAFARCRGGGGPTSCDQTPACSRTGRTEGPGAAPCRCWGRTPGSTGSRSESGHGWEVNSITRNDGQPGNPQTCPARGCSACRSPASAPSCRSSACRPPPPPPRS